MKCKKGFEIQCMKSPAGYYLGTRDSEGFPNCRISGYFKNEIPVNFNYIDRMDAMENQFCHGYSSCFNMELGINDMWPTNLFIEADEAEDKEWGTLEERGIKPD